MVRNGLAIALCVLGWLSGGPALADRLPVAIQPPQGCNLALQGEGTWICAYSRKVDAEGRDRKVVLSFHEVPLATQVVEQLRTMSPFDIEMAFTQEIVAIDQAREQARPEGKYLKKTYHFLTADERPPGFVACVRLIDQMTLLGSTVTNDRIHLHCWATDLKAGTASQLLLSMLEFNSPSRPVAASLGEEFSAMVRSLALR